MARAIVRSKPKAPRARRSRRSTQEIVDRLMEAARLEFERNGYAGTKTAVIARHAGVTEALIFSNFGSKASLFHDSIFKPLNRHFLEFCSTHLVEPGDAAGLREGTQEYILDLQQFMARHSKMLMSLVVAQTYAHDDVDGLNRIEGLHDFFARASSTTRNRLIKKPKVDPRLMTRISFAAILACVIFKDWLFPEGLATQRQIRTAITHFVMDGLNANATPIVRRHSKKARQ